MGGGKKDAEGAGAGGGSAGLTKTGIGGVHMAFADNARADEADAVELLVAEWEKNGVLVTVVSNSEVVHTRGTAISRLIQASLEK